ncbi:MAG TPA: serine hydrolase domain-containing protein [Hymenobacter sp.]|jgi:CubicO group peptidase (beta-lactamase class C family)
MKHFLLILWACTLSFSAASQKRGWLAQRVDSIISPLVLTNNYSGTVLVAKDGKVLFSKAYGAMNREYELKNTPDTKFMLASASMVFTSAAILKLHESGKLGLQDPVAKYFPTYQYGQQVTLHDLLAQRSGIPAIGTGGKVNYDSITKFEHTAMQLYAYFKDAELLYAPGTRYNHGRSDYILLAAIVEKVSGLPFGQYLQQAIFAPLGMTHSGHYASDKQIIPNLAKGYAPQGLYGVESAAHLDWSSKTGHGSIYSTSGDLQKFALAALENKFLSPESWKRIFTDYAESGVGYGWFIGRHLNRDRYQMNGRSPGYSSYLGLYPQEKLTVIVLSNNYVSLPAGIGKSIGALAFNEPFERLNITNEAVPAGVAQKLIGTYRFDQNFYVPNFELAVHYENGHLITTWGGLLPINKADKSAKEFIARNFWSSVRFVENEKGEVTQLLFDAHKGIKK